MSNEILLICSVPLCYSAVLLAYRLFGRSGLYMMTAAATILANIEVLILIEAFGLEQTLGNVMFAATYLITDILSENEGKASAAKAVWLGVFTSALMLLFSQYWLLYTPAADDWAAPHIAALFAITPRLLLGSFLGYAISQRIDVWLYHRWWDLTTARSGSRQSYLWLRNNGSTLISQIVNTVIFTSIAFGGIYDRPTLLAVMGSSYLIYIFTSLLDTPVVYIARWLKQKGHIPA
ncbi:MAG: queuosine precursor transporter [Firmicutes bacterium]|nr:queuosine precursor transporter [Bacillota bacterium]MBQ3111838.1 queuosine precursor transporter [Bacillota bacterium]